VVILTGHATIDAAVAATKAAPTISEKTVRSKGKLLLCVERAVEHKVSAEEAQFASARARHDERRCFADISEPENEGDRSAGRTDRAERTSLF
jgi:FixJ family two-component response regulator